MDKRYQVFVSSTFVDLKEERNAVSKAILDLGHIPSGMEMFPASPKSQLDYIKKIIDNCDYYLLILGGRYGTLDEDGLSFTEKEFDYALNIGIPVLAFLHEDTGNLKSRNVETEPGRREALEKFRERVLSGRVVKMWRDLNDLQSSVIVSLTAEFADNPRTGWRRDDGSLTAAVKEQISKISSSRDFWVKRSGGLEDKLKEYEGLENSQIEIRYSGEGGARSITIGAGELIKEFAFSLQTGLGRDAIQEGLESLIRHKHDSGANSISSVSINNASLFFEVFELANKDDNGKLIIRDDKKWLLKAAFRPFEDVLKGTSGYSGGYSDLDDEIPF